MSHKKHDMLFDFCKYKCISSVMALNWHSKFPVCAHQLAEAV